MIPQVNVVMGFLNLPGKSFVEHGARFDFVFGTKFRFEQLIESFEVRVVGVGRFDDAQGFPRKTSGTLIPRGKIGGEQRAGGDHGLTLSLSKASKIPDAVNINWKRKAIMSEIPETPVPPNAPENPASPPEPPMAPVAPETASSVTETGLAPNIAAGIAAVFPLLGGIIFYFIEKKHPFVRFYALQSAYFGAGAFLASVSVTILVGVLQIIPILGQILGSIISLAWFFILMGMFVIWIITMVKAFSGKEWEIPWVGKLARKHLAEGLFFFVKSPAL